MRPALFCLDGPLRGQTLCAVATPARIGSAKHCELRFPPSDDSDAGEPMAAEYAVITATDNGFYIESTTTEPVIVNDRPTTRSRLDNGDVVHIGKDGPLVRFRSMPGGRPTKTLRQVLDDSSVLAKASLDRRRTKTRQYVDFARQFTRDAVRNGTRSLKVALAGLAAIVLLLTGALIWLVVDSGKQREHRDALEQALGRETTERRRLESVLTDITERTRKREADFVALMKRLDGVDRDVSELGREVSTIGADADAAAAVYRRFAPAVCLVSIRYSFFHAESGQFVRKRLDPDTGKEIDSRRGPALTLGGEGDKLITGATGTGFLISDDGKIVTNRHVADAWWSDDDDPPWVHAGWRAHRESSVAFFHDYGRSIDLVRLGASDDADVAVMQLARVPDGRPRIRLAAADTAQNGDALVLLGFPLGMEGLMPKLEENAFAALRAGRPAHDEQALRIVAPLGGVQAGMTSGLASNVTMKYVVHTAPTTSGGSGGPIFDRHGAVVGVNVAITRFDGASLGVPVRYVHDLLTNLGDGPNEVTTAPREISVEEARVEQEKHRGKVGVRK